MSFRWFSLGSGRTNSDRERFPRASDSRARSCLPIVPQRSCSLHDLEDVGRHVPRKFDDGHAATVPRGSWSSVSGEQLRPHLLSTEWLTTSSPRSTKRQCSPSVSCIFLTTTEIVARS